MKIIIENLSSPGASFSENTNSVIIKISNWIEKNNFPVLKFIDFRKRLSNDEGINDNNARNIYPLLKNCGFISYESGDQLDSKYFFTEAGQLYVKILKVKEGLEGSSKYTFTQKNYAKDKLDVSLAALVKDGLNKIISNDQINYSEGLRWYLYFIDRYKKICREEFAYMVYVKKQNPDNWQKELDSFVDQYRRHDFDLEVIISVRNDQKGKDNHEASYRHVDIKFFTAFGYYSALFSQAGIVTKKKEKFETSGIKNTIIYYCLINNQR